MLRHYISTIGLILILAGSTAYAKSGPYVGASIGAQKTTWDAKDNTSEKYINFGGTGAVGNLFLGYGAMLNDILYLGGEAFVGLSSTNGSTKTINNVTGRVKSTYNYGASVIPGVMVSKDTLAYTRLGVIRSRFEQESSRELISSHDKTVTGRQLGVGVRTAVTDKVDFQAEYTYSAYQSLNAFGSQMKPSDSQIKIGFVYNFG